MVSTVSTPCSAGQYAVLATLNVQSTDTSTFTVNTNSPGDAASVSYPSGSTATATTCFNKAEVGVTTRRSIQTTITCQNLLFSCPINYKITYACRAVPASTSSTGGGASVPASTSSTGGGASVPASTSSTGGGASAGGFAPCTTALACSSCIDARPATCTGENNNGQYQCCLRGTVDSFNNGDITCARQQICPVDSCALIDCGAHGTCSAGNCFCSGGYTGTTCSVAPAPVDPCASVSCGAHGTCRAGNCMCSGGYAGSTCAVAPPDPCASVSCGVNGMCDAGTCTCTNGYTGTACITPPSNQVSGSRPSVVNLQHGILAALLMAGARVATAATLSG